MPGVGWFPLMREAMLLRNALVPYIYTHAAMRTHSRGESLLTPMYYDEAAVAHAEAYGELANQQYWFGRDLLVAPITEPCLVLSGGGCEVKRAVWLPPVRSDSVDGDGEGAADDSRTDDATWVAWGSWEVIGGSPAVVYRNASLADIPVFARGGAALPMRDMMGAYSAAADPMVWLVVPGATSGGGQLYEDDGVSTDHRYGNSATISFSHAWLGSAPTSSPGSRWRATISAASGRYVGMPSARQHRAALKGIRLLPKAASCDGSPLAQSPPGSSSGFWLELDAPRDVRPAASDASLVLACERLNMSASHTILAQF